MTADEFKVAYCRASMITTRSFEELGLCVQPCDCDGTSTACKGWMITTTHKRWCSSCHRITADEVKRLHPHVPIRDKQPLYGIRARVVVCPHCRDERWISGLHWFCSCQVCDCEKTPAFDHKEAT